MVISAGQSRIADRVELGRAIRRLRRAKGWSQVALGENVGVSQNWISNIERGWPCSKELLRAILERLDVPDAETVAENIHDAERKETLSALAKLGRVALHKVEKTIPPLEVPETDPSERTRYMGEVGEGLFRIGDAVFEEDGEILFGSIVGPDGAVLRSPDHSYEFCPTEEQLQAISQRVRLKEARASVILRVVAAISSVITLAPTVRNVIKALVVDCGTFATAIEEGSAHFDREAFTTIVQLHAEVDSLVRLLLEAARHAWMCRVSAGEEVSTPPWDKPDGVLHGLPLEAIFAIVEEDAAARHGIENVRAKHNDFDDLPGERTPGRSKAAELFGVIQDEADRGRRAAERQRLLAQNSDDVRRVRMAMLQRLFGDPPTFKGRPAPELTEEFMGAFDRALSRLSRSKMPRLLRDEDVVRNATALVAAALVEIETTRAESETSTTNGSDKKEAGVIDGDHRS